MKKFFERYPTACITLLLGLVYVITVALWKQDNVVVGISAAVFALAVGADIAYTELRTRKLLVRSKQFSRLMDVEHGFAFEELKLACCAIDDDGLLLWVNSTFASSFGVDRKTPVMKLQSLLGGGTLSKLKNGEGYRITFHDSHYSVNSCTVPMEDGSTSYLLYFYDDTAFINLKKQYKDTRPVVMLTLIDNSDDVYEKFRESECTAIFSIIEQEIDSWASQYGALCRKYSNSRMLIVTEELALQQMLKDKFSVLEKIRNLEYDGRKVDVTLSMGVGSGGGLNEVRNFARQALDMAQSRGGDQAAIKDKQNYKFIGGAGEGKEQKNKVKTRFIAKTVADLIQASSNVLIMGHRFSDFDAFGASAGIYSLCRQLNVPANIVANRKTTLAGVMIDRYIAQFGLDVVISPERSEDFAGEKTLVVVVDTHKKDFTESPALLDKAKTFVVIDHHRKSVGYIENAAMFYHRPTSSSASEMVAEILQYAENEVKVDPLTAQALLSGIMLDTRSFVMRSGVRTFEAAAYLKSCSADTVAAKKLFASDMETFRLRNAVIDGAEKYRNVCAISVADFESKSIRLITSQAADEMLNIEGVKMSFVLYPNGSEIDISARSYGEVNVQLIMEALGGGGHQAMSACQLQNANLDQALDLLKGAIDNYLNEN